MSIARHIAPKALAALLIAGLIPLSACSSRDTLLAEKLSAAEAAATRAEKAAERAEKSAAKLDHQPAAVAQAESQPAETQDPAQAEQERLDAASAPTNHG